MDASTRKKFEPEKLDLRSLDVAHERREEVVRLFPEARTEGGNIDFDQLKRALGETVDAGRERYGFIWPGKAECFKAIQAPSFATLRPAPKDSVNFETTENLIIEGDNLEVLKLLQKSYLDKVTMIYIDPPYNTGKDFIYPDNYSESLQTYLEYTGQVDSEGRKFGTNTETDGRFHSKWLNMMYPRLYLAKNLLRDDGSIWVSIDDGELENLRRILDEVFGDENFIATFIWEKRRTRENRRVFSFNHDYIICFAKNKPAFESARNLLPLTDEVRSRYANPDNDSRGDWQSVSLAARPIVIIDEPQSVDSTEKAQEAIKALNPLCTLRYSATHRNPYNLVYRLDPVRAFELRLVKQIIVASAAATSGANDAFIRVEDISYKPSIKAKVRIHVQGPDGPNERSVTIKNGDDLFVRSNERASYAQGYSVAEINAEPDAEFIRFTNGLTMRIGQEVGGMRDDVWRVQIRHTVKKHLDKELQLHNRGIKVLSLFFIDRVASYRDYDSSGKPTKGKFAQWFEEELAALAKEPRYSVLEWTKLPRDQLHNGYFAQDRKGVFKDTKVTPRRTMTFTISS
jgi:DNA modification methylase